MKKILECIAEDEVDYVPKVIIEMAARKRSPLILGLKAIRKRGSE